jgi:hypothetical protein
MPRKFAAYDGETTSPRNLATQGDIILIAPIEERSTLCSLVQSRNLRCSQRPHCGKRKCVQMLIFERSHDKWRKSAELAGSQSRNLGRGKRYKFIAG